MFAQSLHVCKQPEAYTVQRVYIAQMVRQNGRTAYPEASLRAANVTACSLSAGNSLLSRKRIPQKMTASFRIGAKTGKFTDEG